jgi:hypothetical protein
LIDIAAFAVADGFYSFILVLALLLSDQYPWFCTRLGFTLISLMGIGKTQERLEELILQASARLLSYSMTTL